MIIAKLIPKHIN